VPQAMASVLYNANPAAHTSPSNLHSTYIYGAIKGAKCVLSYIDFNSGDGNKMQISNKIQPAFIVYHLATGKIVHIIANNDEKNVPSSHHTVDYENEINAYLATVACDQIDLSKYPFVYNNDDDVILPGLIDIDNTICDIELGLNQNSFENICKGCIFGGVTTMVDLPKTTHHYGTNKSPTLSTFHSHCFKIETFLQAINSNYAIDIIPFLPLTTHLNDSNNHTSSPLCEQGLSNVPRKDNNIEN